MVDQNIEDVIYNDCQHNIPRENIASHISNGVWKCKIQISNFLFLIEYEIMDNYYKFKIESNNENVFLTESKKFKKQTINCIKANKDNKREMKSHIKAICIFINALLVDKIDIEKLRTEFASDLGFDGIFL